MEFEWDPGKDASNVAKHGVSFLTAAQMLERGDALELESAHGGEARWIAIGRQPTTQKVIAVVYTTREDRYRIISARRARRSEKEAYEEHERKETERKRGRRAGPVDA